MWITSGTRMAMCAVGSIFSAAVLVARTNKCILRLRMKPRQKRPLGITLLALGFLWIGCIGTIIFPFIGFSGGATMLWRQLAAGTTYSEAGLRVISYLLNSIWFLLYVAYAVIGFGLWKLKNWGRQAVLGVWAFLAVISVLALPFFVRPGTLALAVVIGIALPSAWIVWYLKRPRVRFAFGAWPSIHDGASMPEPPAGLSKIRRTWVAVSIVATCALYVGSLMVAVEDIVRRSQIYQITLKEAQDSPCVAAVLGTPLTAGWMTTGRTEESNTEGSADLNIPIHGPKGKGGLETLGQKKNGTWEITSLVLVHQSNRIQITPATSASSCQ
jgi:hypothetical protein